MAMSPNEQINLLTKEVRNLTNEKLILTKHVRKIDESISKLEKELADYKKMGSANQIATCFKEAERLIESYSKIKTKLAKADRMLNESNMELRKYRKLGTPSTLVTAFKEAEKLMNLYESSKVTEMAKKYDMDKSLIKETMKMCESANLDIDQYLSKLRPSKQQLGNSKFMRRTPIVESTKPKMAQKILSSLDKRLDNYDRRAGK